MKSTTKYKMLTRALGAAAFVTLAMGGAGCALTSKADVVDIRYFSPEQVKPHLTGGDASTAPPAPAPHDALEVRLGRVSSGPNLRERIAYRDAAFELGYYEDWRWVERPETFVRRELGRTLFEEHGLHRVFNGSAPTLDVEVISFDDLRLKTGRAARVQLKAILSDDSGVLWEDTLTVDRPVSAEKPKIEDVVGAMAGALDTASEQVTTKVQEMLLVRRKALADADAAGAAGSGTQGAAVTTTTLTQTTATGVGGSGKASAPKSATTTTTSTSTK